MIKYTWDSYTIKKNEIMVQFPTLEHDFELHNHDFTELVIIIGGEGKHIIEDKTYPLQTGDVYVIKGDTSHGFKDPRQLEIINIMFNPLDVLFEDIRRKMNGYRAMFEIEPLYRIEHNFNAKLTLDTFHLNEATNLAKEMHLMPERHSIESKIIIKTLLNLLIAKLSSLYDHKEELKPKQLLLLSDVLDYIENKMDGELDTEILAKKVNFSVRHFTRLFKSIFSITPKQYIMNQRLRFACSLLYETDLTISAIAVKCGYTDSSYFARLFLEHYGLTPKEYRKNRGGGI